MSIAINSIGEQLLRVVAIIPVYNRVNTTIACIETLKAQTYKSVDIVVVDGGSSDGTVETIRNGYPDVRLYTDAGTLWWTDAVKLAVENELPNLGRSDYIFLVNNDTILDNDTIERLVATSRNNNDAIVTSAVREVSGRLISSGARMQWGFEGAEPLGYDEEEILHNEVLHADVVYGRATLIPISVFAAIGNFDAIRFPQYYGDSDFFLRASRAGFSLLIDCRSVVKCREDDANTGVHYVEKAITLKRAWQMATSRKSNLNLVAACRFMWIHAPAGKKMASAASAVARNCREIAYFYSLRHASTIHRFRKIKSFVLSLPPFPLLRNYIRIRPLFLTFGELRRHGFDPIEMLQKKEIYASEIPHTYHLNIPITRILRKWGRFSGLVLRNYNPCAIQRIRRFTRAWVSKKKYAHNKF